VARALLDRHGRTYAEEAGIRLADEPSQRHLLLVLAMLLGARVSAEIAAAAAAGRCGQAHACRVHRSGSAGHPTGTSPPHVPSMFGVDDATARR